jgi:hypothetical protein
VQLQLVVGLVLQLEQRQLVLQPVRQLEQVQQRRLR